MALKRRVACPGCVRSDGPVLWLRQRDVELGSGADAELFVRSAEVELDGARGHDELSGDVVVGQALGGELGDASLGGGQCVGSGASGAAGARSGAAQVGQDLFGEGGRSAALGDLGRAVQRLARIGALPAPEMGGAEVAEHVRAGELRRRAVEDLCGFPEVVELVLVVAQGGSGAQRERYRARGAERAGERELLFDELSRLVGVAKPGERSRGAGPPPSVWTAPRACSCAAVARRSA